MPVDPFSRDQNFPKRRSVPASPFRGSTVLNIDSFPGPGLLPRDKRDALINKAFLIDRYCLGDFVCTDPPLAEREQAIPFGIAVIFRMFWPNPASMFESIRLFLIGYPVIGISFSGLLDDGCSAPRK